MTTEELLKVRYKVIADYPEIERHNIRVGDIITKEEKTMYADKTQDGTPVVAIDHEIFTANFKKLEWWQERKESDMPEYVKMTYNLNWIYKVNSYDVNNGVFWHSEKHELSRRVEGDEFEQLRYFIPATKEEYENQPK